MLPLPPGRALEDVTCPRCDQSTLQVHKHALSTAMIQSSRYKVQKGWSLHEKPRSSSKGAIASSLTTHASTGSPSPSH